MKNIEKIELKKEALKIWITHLPNYVINIIAFFIPNYYLFEAGSILNLRKNLDERRQRVLKTFREEKELQEKNKLNTK